MSAFQGPNLALQDDLVIAVDGGNVRSTMRPLQSSNILPNPHDWTTGNDGSSGYGRNGDAAEQLRAWVDDDPWGRRSIIWRTVPDATSGADGGWNSSSYSIDRAYTYRWSVWVRRHTSGTGGTFYFGLNPAPIRNDTNASQSNPYFTYPAQSLLTQNTWYLVVAHCFYEGYSGNRHPDSGWYENGVKIADKHYGNVGQQDVRWDPTTTTAIHRTYHYYTTNTSSGLEFAFPRLDKLDGTQPSVAELISNGESGWRYLNSNGVCTLYNGITYNSSNGGSLVLDGTDEYVETNYSSGNIYTPSYEAWIYDTKNNSGYRAIIQNNVASDDALYINPSNYLQYWPCSSSTLTVPSNQWVYVAFSYNGNSFTYCVNGTTQTISAACADCTDVDFIRFGGHGSGDGERWQGRLAQVKVYDYPLSAAQMVQNFNSTRNRFGV